MQISNWTLLRNYLLIEHENRLWLQLNSLFFHAQVLMHGWSLQLPLALSFWSGKLMHGHLSAHTLCAVCCQPASKPASQPPSQEASQSPTHCQFASLQNGSSPLHRSLGRRLSQPPGHSDHSCCDAFWLIICLEAMRKLRNQASSGSQWWRT